VLGGKSGQGFGFEVGERSDGVIAFRQASSEGVVFVLEPCDLREAGVGDLAGVALGLKPSFKLFAQVGVGSVAVEGGAVDACFAGQGLDVAVAAGRDLTAQEPVHRCPDAVVVLGALGRADSHGVSWSDGGVVAASISAMTRRARW
jgi:hypothetical protein